jgi:peptidyl-prolyl cis-trans isomerase C
VFNLSNALLFHQFINDEMIKTKQIYLASVVAIFICLACAASPSARAQNRLPSVIVAIVNGKEIPLSLLEQSLRASIAQGRKDSQELRQALKDELINREIFLQEAINRGLDRPAEVQVELAQIRQTYLINRLFADYQTKHPITDAQIKDEYDRQITAAKDEQQYKVSVIMVQTELEAKLVIELLSAKKTEDSFAEVARNFSLDPSKRDGGSLDWLLPAQLTPAVAGAVADMTIGAYSQVPIVTSPGFSIVKLDDRRPFKAPTLEAAKDKIISTLVQQQRNEYLKQLKVTAKVTQ